MNKYIIAFFIFLFLVCAMVGFGATREVRTLTAHTPDPAIPADQVNLILVRVDDLTHDKPGLVSIWAVFISHSVSPSMILKQIFPDTSSATSQQLAESFSVNSQKKLSSGFVDQIKELGLPDSATVLVDNNSLSEWTKAILGHTLNIAPIASLDPLNLAAVRKADRDLFKNVCMNINGRSGVILNVTNSTPPVTPNSDQVYFSDYFKKWMGLVTSLHFTSCEVLVGP